MAPASRWTARGTPTSRGATESDQSTFPVTGGPDLTYNGSVTTTDAFVAKVNAAGTALVYAGYIGGAGDDYGSGIAVDGAGNAYVTGATYSDQATFPVTGGPDLTYNGGSDTGLLRRDAFVAKVNAAGTARSTPATSAASAKTGAKASRWTARGTPTSRAPPIPTRPPSGDGRPRPDLQRSVTTTDAFVAKVAPFVPSAYVFLRCCSIDEAHGRIPCQGMKAFARPISAALVRTAPRPRSSIPL